MEYGTSFVRPVLSNLNGGLLYSAKLNRTCAASSELRVHRQPLQVLKLEGVRWKHHGRQTLCLISESRKTRDACIVFDLVGKIYRNGQRHLHPQDGS